MIVFEVAYKECAETARHLVIQPDVVFDGAEYNRVMDLVRDRSIVDAKALITARKEVG